MRKGERARKFQVVGMGRLEPEKILQAALKALDGVKDDVEDHAARLSQGRLAPTPHVVALSARGQRRLRWA
jgi:hypothetical protein